MSLTPRRLLISLLLGLLCALGLSALSLSGVLARAQWFCYHALFEGRGPTPAPGDITLIAIDEASLEDLGVWPPPRTIYAELLDGLFRAGVQVIGLDVTFPQAQSPETDAAFAAALARHRGRVVLAANFQPLGNDQAQGEQLVLPYRPFREAAVLGFANLPFDEDVAIHRFVPLRQGLDPTDLSMPKTYESFDWAIARRFRPGAAERHLEPGRDSYLINYSGAPGHIRSLSLSLVLEALRANDRKILEGLRGDVVLVGATSLRMQDLYATPFSARAFGGGSGTFMPGVEIHANILDTLLHRAPIRPLAPAGQVALLLALGAGAAWGFAVIPPWWGFAALIAGALGVALAASAAFSGAGRWVDPAAPLLLLALVYTTALIQHFTDAERTRRFYRRTFERYVAPEIVSELLRNPGLAPKLGGEKREVSVLFSDIRSFTTISERLRPEEVVEFLNAYLTAMAEVIHAENGCIDKYIGDAILALWGNVKPLTSEEAARSAVRAALAMRARVLELQPQWQARGYPLIEIGVGVNTGEAIVGNIGSPNKLEFGVIGDSINVASRLEGLTKEYGGALLVSGRTRELLGDRFLCRYLDTVKVKGREAPVPIYAVEGEAPSACPVEAQSA